MRPRLPPAAGHSLLELMVAMSMLTVGVLGFMACFYSGARGARSPAEVDDARTALENVTELLRGATFANVYGDYNGSSVEVAGLLGADGQPARVAIDCFVDETELPLEFGPLVDIDGVEGLEQTNCSTSYKLLPVRLRLVFEDSLGATQIRETFVVLGKDV